jgi:phenylalanyl-tRNA synthetase beta chain
MKLSLAWLSDFVSWGKKDARIIAERLTQSTAEVECIEEQGARLQNCVVGNIRTVRKHTDARRLSLCDVQTDCGVKRVVCGGMNLREGMLVAFAHVGARVLWHGREEQELQKMRIRGEESEGMICTAEELELQRWFPTCVGRSVIGLESGQWAVVSGKLKVGAPLREALGLTDTIFHIGNHSITNRPDLFSHVGFARECVALQLGTWKRGRPMQRPLRFARDPLPFTVRMEAAPLVPRYCACMVRIESVGETPPWMVRRLEATGWRSVNLPIDIANFVMIERGSPLHSFDADDFHGDIHVRVSRAGEKVTTLDGVERNLPDGAIVMSDNEGIFDLLGIMGGLRSSTKEMTRNIYLQCAALDPVSIRRAILATSHRTEGATVYEKGVPPAIIRPGLLRALQLFLELVPGAHIVSGLESRGTNEASGTIPLSLERVRRHLGVAIPVRHIKELLSDLEFRVSGKGNTLRITPPLHRRDIKEEADVIEEIARIRGYESFSPSLPTASIAPPPRGRRVDILRHLLSGFGFSECVSSPLTKPDEGEISLENPLAGEQSTFHGTIKYHLIRSAQKNLERGDRDIAIFEIANVFHRGEGHLELSILSYTPSSSGGGTPALHLQSVLSSITRSFGLAVEFTPIQGGDPLVHSARAADISVEGRNVGSLFEIHPRVRRACGFQARTALIVIDLSRFFAFPPRPVPHCPRPPYPTISYDETIHCARSASPRGILKNLERAHALLRYVCLSKAFEQGERISYTFHFTYGAPDRTLTEEEVWPIHREIAKQLATYSQR